MQTALLLAVSYETHVQVRDVRPDGNGRLIATLAHQERVVAACACGGRLVTGDRDGVLRVWRASDGSLVWQWAAYAGPVSLLRCRGERLLSAGRSGLAEQHALLWDLAGRAQPPQAEVVSPRVWPPAWHLRLLQRSGLDRSAGPLHAWLRANEPWTQVAGVACWAITLLVAGWQLRRRAKPVARRQSK